MTLLAVLSQELHSLPPGERGGRREGQVWLWYNLESPQHSHLGIMLVIYNRPKL